MEVLHLTTLQNTVMIIVAVTVSLFFLMSALFAGASFALVRKVKKVVAKAEDAIDSVEAATETIKRAGAKAGGPLAVIKIIGGIVDAVNGRKKHDKD